MCNYAYTRIHESTYMLWNILEGDRRHCLALGRGPGSWGLGREAFAFVFTVHPPLLLESPGAGIASVTIPKCPIAVVVLRSLRLSWSKLTKGAIACLWRDIWLSRYDLTTAMESSGLKRNEWISFSLKRQQGQEGGEKGTALCFHGHSPTRLSTPRQTRPMPLD